VHQRLRQSRARKEFEAALALRSIGIATVKPVALAERYQGSLLEESYLITETIPEGRPLFDLVEADRSGQRLLDPKTRAEWARRLAQLAASLHQSGFEHRDLHERNIIHAPIGDDFQLILVDLSELRCHWRLDQQASLDELGRLGRYFSIRASRTDRLRFFLEYASRRGWDPPSARRLARDVERSTLESRGDFWRRRDVRAPKRVTGVRTASGPGWEALACRELPRGILESWADDPGSLLSSRVRRWLKNGQQTQVAEIDAPELGPGATIILKRYAHRSAREWFASFARDNPAQRAWNNGASLRLREIPTPRPIALVHQRSMGVLRESYLWTECVPCAVTIVDYLDRTLAEADPAHRPAILRGCMNAAADLLRMLHDRRVTHDDLKATNVLASATDDPARPRLWFVDLDGVQTWQRVPLDQRVQNLARFSVSFHNNPHISQTDRLRFLERYLGGLWTGTSRRRAFWQAIDHWSKRKLERNRRLGRIIG
jgi:tRNA A-37 threonylcarbamoyl transferase component Bud32